MTLHDRQAGVRPDRPDVPAPPAGQIARLQAALVVAIVAATLAAAAGLAHNGQHGWALVALVAPLAVHAAALGLEFAWMRRCNRDDPAPAASGAQALRAWAGECVDAIRVFAVRQPFRSRMLPDPVRPEPAGRVGVLLIHGFVCNRGIWLDWLRRLQAQGVAIVTVNLEPAFGPIDAYLPIVEAAVQRLERMTGRAPVVVAHSMGGLVLRRWWSLPGNGGRVGHAITLGTPHRGTWLARFAVSPNAAEMRIGSDWLRRLAASESPANRRRMTCYYGHCDNIVFPASMATLDGADNRHLAGTGHISLVWRPEPFDELQRRLAEPAPRPAATAQL